MPSSTSSVGKYSTYSIYSSYPSYRTPSSSSYSSRTTSLDRSSYSSNNVGGSNYYRYSSKASSILPPRSNYGSSYSDSLRSRNLRSSPTRSSYHHRLVDTGRLLDTGNSDRESRYSSSRIRDYSSSRDSGYSSHYTPREHSVDYSYTNGDVRRRGSSVLGKRSEFINNSIDCEEDTMKVSDRIKAFESRNNSDEDRLEMRRRRLGLSPTKDITATTTNIRNGLLTKSSRLSDDNRKSNEENGNENGIDTDRTISNLCRKYNLNLNLTNGDDYLHREIPTGCSGGDASSVTPLETSNGLIPPSNHLKTRPYSRSSKKDCKGSDEEIDKSYNSQKFISSPSTGSESSLSSKVRFFLYTFLNASNIILYILVIIYSYVYVVFNV